MPQARRIAFVLGSIISIAVVAVIYAEAAMPLIQMGTGDMSGPFSDQIRMVEEVVPPVLALLLLGAVVYQIVGAAQDERTVNQRRPPRR